MGISIQGLVKSFGATPVLEGLDLEVPAGSRVAILGPSGIGKTTLLRLIAGLVLPDAGEIRLGGEPVTGPGLHVPPHRRGVGIVFQNYALFPHMSVAQNVAFPLKARRISGPEIADRVAWALSLVKLAGFGDRRIDQLSGGQRQRVALARAFLKNAPVLLLDEPTSAVDVKTEAVIIEALDRLMVGRTTFMIAHRLSTLEGCDVLLEVSGGRVTIRSGAVEQHLATS